MHHTNEQREFPDIGDLPFGPEMERRRIELENSAKDRRTLIEKIRAEIFRYEQAVRRREDR